MNKEQMLGYLEMVEEMSRLPLYNPLEVGFRHSPLTQKEQLDRYNETCAHINQLVQLMIKEVRDGKETLPPS